MTALSQFKATAAFVNKDGTLTPEAIRLLGMIHQRVGGTVGDLGLDTFQPLTKEDALEPLPAVSAPEAVAEMVMQPLQPAQAWPVGSIFTSVVATDPSILLGYGTWAAFGAGRVLVGLDAGDADFDTVKETGGDKTKAISAHTGAAVADHADHSHQVNSNVTTTPVAVQSGSGVTVVSSITNNEVTSFGASATLTHSVTQPSAHTDLSVVQPYAVVYFWERTA